MVYRLNLLVDPVDDYLKSITQYVVFNRVDAIKAHIALLFAIQVQNWVVMATIEKLLANTTWPGATTVCEVDHDFVF